MAETNSKFVKNKRDAAANFKRVMSGKELDFIENMDKKRNLWWSEKQVDWLDKIYERIC